MTRNERKPVVMLLAKPYSVDTRVKNEAETLTGAGHKVTVLSWDRWGREQKEASVNGVDVVSPRLMGGSDLFASNKGSGSSKLNYALSAVLLQFYCVAWCIRNMKEEYIVHANDFNTLIAGVALRLIKPGQVRLVYDCHELTPTVYAEWYGAIVGAAAGLFERTLVRYADAVVTVSPSFARYFATLTRRASSKSFPVTVLYNTVKSSDLPSGDKAYWRGRFGLTGFVFTFVGAMRGVYALDELVEAAKMFKESAIPANFVIVGGGDEFAALERKIASYNLNGRVRLIPQLPNKEALEYLKAGDVSFGVYRSPDTNARIALPWKVFEAMACGTPVMVLENTTAWNLVKENGIGFAVASSNTSEIYEKLLWAVNHPDALADMSSRAREAYGRYYNWESASQQFRAAYSCL
ncbi:MAG: glycosyltransferase family 4 protein [Thaumarchaeota archaeon]|nr:glycosyltransferase family 4 protein [Nitrososphaerota archaeon]